ncbi:hypothetical protein PUN28_012734 [Cardiocondyla obscurior]|uniref:Uncharacterized protein n=1 Tax=Cardiocondyla obscurior TaxID=286306 RepID=A0AAW2F5Z7_9HYME
MSVSRTAGGARSKEGSGAPESRRCRCRGRPGAPGRRKARERPSLGDVGVEEGRERPVEGRLGSARSKEDSGAPESRRCRCRGRPGAPGRRKARERPSRVERSRFWRPGEPGRGRLGSAQVLGDRMLGCSPARKKCLVCARGSLYTRGPGGGGYPTPEWSMAACGMGGWAARVTRYGNPRYALRAAGRSARKLNFGRGRAKSLANGDGRGAGSGKCSFRGLVPQIVFVCFEQKLYEIGIFQPVFKR